MKHTGKLTAIVSLALTATLILGACDKSTSQTKNPPSLAASVKKSTSSSSSSKKVVSSSTLKDAASSKSSQVETQESTSQPMLASSSSSEAITENTVTPPSLEVVTKTESKEASEPSISNLIPFAGTWMDERGNTITINPDGTTTGDYKLEVYENGSYGIRSKDGAGAAVFYAPGGQEFPETIAPKEYTEGTDVNKDRLVMGQSVSDMSHPFYRVQ